MFTIVRFQNSPDFDVIYHIIIVINAQLRHKNNLGFSGLFLQDNLGLFLEPEWQHWLLVFQMYFF